MKRISLVPRPGWQERLEKEGCAFHTIDGVEYWNDSAAYVFSSEEVDAIEGATHELHGMCLAHVSDVVRNGNYVGYKFADEVKAIIDESWKNDHPHLYGRFDLLYNGSEIKLAEYNADTPTALPEAAVWQWQALEDRGWPDQYNSIHEKLIERWKQIEIAGERIHFVASREGRHEDWGNVHYLMQTATEAGYDTSSLDLEQLGWNDSTKTFRDLQERPITTCCKLYPWEMMLQDEFGWSVRESKTQWIEPAWKLLLSTKALLPLLWKRHPRHPLLLEAHFEEESWGQLSGQWVRKPILGREGANISIVETGAVGPSPAHYVEQYDKAGYIVQRYFRVPPCGQHVPVIGSWVVGDKACGMGLREETGPVTTNASQFVPHYFES